MGHGGDSIDPRRRRVLGSRGGAIIETALCFMPFMALLLGITDLSLAMFIRQTMQHAVREGVRYAITYQVEDGLCHVPSIKAVVKKNAMGLLTDQKVEDYVKVKFYKPDGSAESGQNRPGHLVEVSVENLEWKWIAPLWRVSTPMKVTVRSSDRMEGLGGGNDPPCLVTQ